MKKFFEEFKKFINKGNVIDLAVAVIIGAAFGKIVSSLVDDIITPMVSLVMNRVDFADLKIVIVEGTQTASGIVGEIAVYYGRFLKNILDFVIIALSMFLVVKFYNRAKVNLHKQIAEGEAKIAGIFREKKNKTHSGEQTETADANTQNANETAGVNAQNTGKVSTANGQIVSETPNKSGEIASATADTDAQSADKISGANGQNTDKTLNADGQAASKTGGGNGKTDIKIQNPDINNAENGAKDGDEISLLKEIRDLLTAGLGKKTGKK
jgi:large conductance mechanosensitive channel